MPFYLIENMMGFETPIEEGTREDLELKKIRSERKPATNRVGPASNRFVIEATYYVVPKYDWDIHNCPLIPVDLS